jgi:indolepyruvate decarboxylase
MVHVVPEISPEYHHAEPRSNAAALDEAVAETAGRIVKSRQPVLLLGVEVHRFGLQDEVVRLAEQAGIPMAATMLGKGVVSETHPLYLGLYEGALGNRAVTEYVEGSDCALMLGTFMTDINLGIYTAQLDITQCIYVTSEQLRIRHHHYHDVRLEDFVRELIRRGPKSSVPIGSVSIRVDKPKFVLQPDAPITITRLIERLDEQLQDGTIVIADIGDALFAATELQTRGKTEFVSPAYYTSMGFAVPAALGVATARPGERVVAIVGDGAFQMTGMEVSNLLRRKIPAIVIVLNNGGYGIERLLHPGDWEFNEIQPWQYHKLPLLLSGGTGYEVRTEAEFDQALTAAWSQTSEPSILNVYLDRQDRSRALGHLAEAMSQTVTGRVATCDVD